MVNCIPNNDIQYLSKSTPLIKKDMCLFLLIILTGFASSSPVNGANITTNLPYFTSNQSLPKYALDFAPLIYLHSDEAFWPSDLDQHWSNVQPEKNFTIPSSYQKITQDYLSSNNLEKIDPSEQELTYLSAKESIFDSSQSSWLRGVGPPDHNGRSAASAIIIAVDKTLQVGPGWVDVFYLFFYSYNRGNYFYNNRFGDHVGDWENTIIRFHDGKPKYVSPEAHGGQVTLGNSAFNYDVLERINGRPIVYSANGTHGMYPQAGQQNYTGLPIAIYDITNKGHLWDPKLNYKSYFFSNEMGFSYTRDTPIDQQDPQNLGWLKYLGHWGNQKLPLSDPHQTCIGSLCFFEDGPLGPQSKSLGRGWICSSSDCKPQTKLPTIIQSGAQKYNSPYSSSHHIEPSSKSIKFALAVLSIFILNISPL